MSEYFIFSCRDIIEDIIILIESLKPIWLKRTKDLFFYKNPLIDLDTPPPRKYW